MNKSILWLTLLASTGAICACGERSSSASTTTTSSTFISITKPNEGWAQSIEYRTGDDGIQSLTLDGVRFELRDPAAYLLDWDAIGMSGLSVSSSFTYESTKPVAGALLSVSGRAVEIRDGTLFWGDATVGPVAAGDVVIVDADGVRLSEK
jgi:hypothetical protein